MMMVHRTNERAAASSGHPAVPMLDLQQFCSMDECRYYRLKPFSCDGFTWATNGHVAVRVELRPDVPSPEREINIKKLFERVNDVKFFKPSFDLPPASTNKAECRSCNGRGFEHDFPDCECECEECGGSGTGDNAENHISTSIGPTPFC